MESHTNFVRVISSTAMECLLSYVHNARDWQLAIGDWRLATLSNSPSRINRKLSLIQLAIYGRPA